MRRHARSITAHSGVGTSPNFLITSASLKLRGRIAVRLNATARHNSPCAIAPRHASRQRLDEAFDRLSPARRLRQYNKRQSDEVSYFRHLALLASFCRETHAFEAMRVNYPKTGQLTADVVIRSVIWGRFSSRRPRGRLECSFGRDEAKRGAFRRERKIETYG